MCCCPPAVLNSQRVQSSWLDEFEPTLCLFNIVQHNPGCPSWTWRQPAKTNTGLNCVKKALDIFGLSIGISIDTAPLYFCTTFMF